MKKSLAVLALSILTATPALACYSEGVRVGTIQKFSKKGIVAKSWEGELVMQGERFTGNRDVVRGGNIWSFSVTNPAVAKVIDNATLMGGQVALRYCQEMVHVTTDTPYIITQAVLRR